MLKLNIDIDGMKKSKRPTFLKRVGRQLKSIGALKYINELRYAYTKNKNGKLNVEKNTQDYVYSHITFTNICATSSKQKEFWEGFIHKYPQYKPQYNENIFDYGHLECERKWFRLPNQTKEGKPNAQHKIM